MVSLRAKINPGSIRKLEASFRAGARFLTGELQVVIEDNVNQWAQGVIKAIESDERFNELRSNPDLRGMLGLAKQQFKKGSDTDAEDLITQLREYKIKTSRSIRSRSVKVAFPSIPQLERRLTHNLSSVSKSGGVKPGRKQSWFRWWEFGDRGEITSLTVLRKTIGKLAKTGGKNGGQSRDKLLRIIQNRSRSGHAIQIPSLPAGQGIQGRGLVQEKYVNFARIFPARMGQAVKNHVRRNNLKISQFFTRARAV